MYGEDFLNNYESELNSRMPENCVALFKRFTLCKLDHDESILKTKGRVFYTEYQTEPYAAVDGCKNEYSAYNQCYEDFKERFYDLKNYVASLNNQAMPFDKDFERDRKKNMTKYNFGLNKF